MYKAFSGPASHGETEGAPADDRCAFAGPRSDGGDLLLSAWPSRGLYGWSVTRPLWAVLEPHCGADSSE